MSTTEAGPPSGVLRARGLAGVPITSSIIPYVTDLPRVVINGGGFSALFAARESTILSEWVWSYITCQRRVRLITAEHLSPGP